MLYRLSKGRIYNSALNEARMKLFQFLGGVLFFIGCHTLTCAQSIDEQFWINQDSIKAHFKQGTHPTLDQELLKENEVLTQGASNRDSLMALSYSMMAFRYVDYRVLDTFSLLVNKFRETIDPSWNNSGELYGMVGEADYHDGDFESSIKFLELADSLSVLQQDTIVLKRVLRLKSTVYNTLNQPLKGISALKEVQELAAVTKDYYEWAGAHINLGLSYYDSKLYDGALSNFKQALRLTDKIEKESARNIVKVYALNNLGNVYGELGRCDTAVILHRQALEMTPPRYMALIAYGSNGLGQCLLENEQYEESLPYLKKSYEVFSQMNIPEPRVSSANAYAKALIHLGRMKEAKPIVLDAYQYGMKLKTFKGLASAAANLSKIYGFEKNFKLSSAYIDTAIIYQDSIRENYKDEAVAELKIKFDTEKKDAENNQLRAQNELKDKVIEKQNVISLMTLTLAVLIIAILLIMVYSRSRLKKVNLRLKKHQEELKHKNARLQEMNVNNDRLLSIIAHDLRGPVGSVGVLLGYVEEIEDIESKNEHIQVARNSVMGAYDLLEGLLNWAKNEKGLSKFEPRHIVVEDLITKIIRLYSYQFKEKKIVFHKDIASEDLIYADDYMITTILRNLMTNALKFTDTHGQIAIGFKTQKDKTVLSVSDSGVGMSQKQISSILSHNRNLIVKDGTHGEVGTGLGMRLVKDLVVRHGGELKIDSELEVGTSFHIILPFHPLDELVS